MRDVRCAPPLRFRAERKAASIFYGLVATLCILIFAGGGRWLAAWVCRAVGPGREPWCRRRRAASTRRSCARAAFGGACALVLERARPRAVDRSGWVAHPRCRVPLFSIGEGGLPSSGVRGLRPLTCLWSGTARVSSRHPFAGVLRRRVRSGSQRTRSNHHNSCRWISWLSQR